MGEILFTIIIGLSLIGLGFLVVKFPMLIAGYNTMPEAERKEIDIRSYALFMRKVMVIMGSVIAIGSIILYLTDQRDLESPLFTTTIFAGLAFLAKKGRDLTKNIKKSKAQKWIFRIAAIIVAIIFICLIDTGRPAGIEVKDNVFIISGAYSQKIPIADITEVEITNGLPAITLRINGLSFWKYHKGYYRTNNDGKIMLFLHSGEGPYLMVKSTKKPPIYINRSTKKEIDELYGALRKE